MVRGSRWYTTCVVSSWTAGVIIQNRWTYFETLIGLYRERGKLDQVCRMRRHSQQQWIRLMRLYIRNLCCSAMNKHQENLHLLTKAELVGAFVGGLCSSFIYHSANSLIILILEHHNRQKLKNHDHIRLPVVLVLVGPVKCAKHGYRAALVVNMFISQFTTHLMFSNKFNFNDFDRGSQTPTHRTITTTVNNENIL